MKFFGTLLTRGRAIARNVSVIVRAQGPRWHGELRLPKGITISEGNYELQLNDRRSGRILIDTVDEDTAYFNGDGDLKK